MSSVILLNLENEHIMPSVVMSSVIMLSVVASKFGQKIKLHLHVRLKCPILKLNAIYKSNFIVKELR
jgi:hypothetical protein